MRRARLEAAAHADAVGRCVREATGVDPAGLAAVRSAMAVVRLRASGEAEAVEISPSNLARGLSGCLASTLLGWQQRERVGPRGAVRLVINLVP